MKAYTCKTSLIKSCIAAFILLLSSASFAATINLTAAPTQTKLPDGQSVPMWGYSCGLVDANADSATCTALNPAAGTNWSPVIITVPANATGGLTIKLKNNLSFPAGGRSCSSIGSWNILPACSSGSCPFFWY